MPEQNDPEQTEKQAPIGRCFTSRDIFLILKAFVAGEAADNGDIITKIDFYPGYKLNILFTDGASGIYEPAQPVGNEICQRPPNPFADLYEPDIKPSEVSSVITKRTGIRPPYFSIEKIVKIARYEGMLVSKGTLRYYQSEGLIPKPPKIRRNIAVYSLQTISLLKYISHLQENDLKIKDIKMKLTEEGYL